MNRNKMKAHLFAAARRAAQFWGLFPEPLRIGITGSAGKSTVQKLLREMLATKGRTVPNRYNVVWMLALRRFVTGPWYAYWVEEIAAFSKGTITNALKFFRPDISIVTVIRDDHYSAFRGRAAIAEEKGQLVAALPSDGVAVLNADDPLALAMAARTAARVITYGLSAQAMLRATDVSGVWPQRLSMTVTYEGESVRVDTRLIGAFWVTPVLAAIGGALAAGVSLRECAALLKAIAPVSGRVSEVVSPNGIVYLRDDFKSPFWSVPVVLQVLEQAAAPARKILVMGAITDYKGAASRKYRQVARQALAFADKVIFVGKYADSAMKVPENPGDGTLMGFATLYEAHRYLEGYLRRDDLVLIKGVASIDHLERLTLAPFGQVACWKHDCKVRRACVDCRFRMVSATPRDQK